MRAYVSSMVSGSSVSASSTRPNSLSWQIWGVLDLTVGFDGGRYMVELVPRPEEHAAGFG